MSSLEVLFPFLCAVITASLAIYFIWWKYFKSEAAVSPKKARAEQSILAKIPQRGAPPDQPEYRPPDGLEEGFQSTQTSTPAYPVWTQPSVVFLPKSQDSYYDEYEDINLKPDAELIKSVSLIPTEVKTVPDYGAELGTFDSSSTTDIPWDADNKDFIQADVTWGIVSREASTSIYMKVYHDNLASDVANLVESDAGFQFHSPVLGVNAYDSTTSSLLQSVDAAAGILGQAALTSISEGVKQQVAVNELKKLDDAFTKGGGKLSPADMARRGRLADTLGDAQRAARKAERAAKLNAGQILSELDKIDEAADALADAKKASKTSMISKIMDQVLGLTDAGKALSTATKALDTALDAQRAANASGDAARMAAAAADVARATDAAKTAGDAAKAARMAKVTAIVKKLLPIKFLTRILNSRVAQFASRIMTKIAGSLVGKIAKKISTALAFSALTKLVTILLANLGFATCAGTVLSFGALAGLCGWVVLITALWVALDIICMIVMLALMVILPTIFDKGLENGGLCSTGKPLDQIITDEGLYFIFTTFIPIGGVLDAFGPYLCYNDDGSVHFKVPLYIPPYYSDSTLSVYKKIFSNAKTARGESTRYTDPNESIPPGWTLTAGIARSPCDPGTWTSSDVDMLCNISTYVPETYTKASSVPPTTVKHSRVPATYVKETYITTIAKSSTPVSLKPCQDYGHSTELAGCVPPGRGDSYDCYNW